MEMKNWKVVEPITLRGYQIAADDFETVTGRPAKQADAVSIARWQASLESRGLKTSTIRQRLSALSVISGVRVQLPKREKSETVILTPQEVRAIFRHVINSDDRLLFMRLLTLGSQARRGMKAVADNFAAHFLGMSDCMLSTKEISRRLKRYAKKAGIDSELINLRTWCLSGRQLMKHMSVDEVASLAPAAVNHDLRKAYKPLHGIGRRSQSMKSA